MNLKDKIDMKTKNLFALFMGVLGMANSFIPTPEQEALFKKFESGELLSDPERVQLGELVESGTMREIGILRREDSTNLWSKNN